MKKTFFTIITLCGFIIASATYALNDWSHQKSPVEFYNGHTHDADGHAINAPEHSGGTNSSGCHNGSVPYHCH